MKNGNKHGVFASMLLPAVIIAITLSVSTVFAYLTDTDKKENHFIAGETEIEIRESFAPPATPDPGDTVTKNVRITNTGNLDCFVRARLLFADSVFEQITEPFEIGDKWVEGDNGYYYYTLMLHPGETTEALIENVRIRSAFADGTPVGAEDIAKIDSELIVYSEAVEHPQHEGTFGSEEYLNVWEEY